MRSQTIVDRLAATPLLCTEGGGLVALFDDAAAGSLGAILDGSVVAAIDLGCARPLVGLRSCRADLLVRVATATLLHHDVAGPISQALCRRQPRLAVHQAELCTALQEAVGNAVLHGNLEVGSGLRAKAADLGAFADLMARRGADPVHASRPVTIIARWRGESLILSVEDEGPGFHAASTNPAASVTAPSGRGLAEIRAACRRLSHSRGGRRVTMRFSP
ncbi:ATP-binding protein [Paramagnetospirillum kuznetsovii]|uniref:ATP-binding protein n=1 Tax=Paramagnetospirillum kuznetsovii TaxID=2053833 RepID=UPI001374D9F8|nr:ATP-binding protein [Paramagnetospirillum kuznetsovii]